MNYAPPLRSWINKKYLTEKTISQLRAIFSSSQPFPHLELPAFFNTEKLFPLLQALGEETFILKEADLFLFSQTADLVGT